MFVKTEAEWNSVQNSATILMSLLNKRHLKGQGFLGMICIDTEGDNWDQISLRYPYFRNQLPALALNLFMSNAYIITQVTSC